MNHISTLEAIEDTDIRTSDQMLRDIKEANSIRASAERFERHGDSVTALLFRNAAWKLENGKDWLSK